MRESLNPEFVSIWRGAMRFVTMVRHVHPLEFFKLRETGKPSYELCSLAQKSKVFVPDPWRLSGQDLMYKAVMSYDEYYASIPNQCHAMLQIISQKYTHRRKDTLRNILFVAEAVIHRSAYEKVLRVMYSYESIISWVREVKNHNIGHTSVKTALKYMDNSEFFDVTFGKSGDVYSCTRINLNLNHRDLSTEQETQDWLSDLDWVLQEVFSREEMAHDKRVIYSE